MATITARKRNRTKSVNNETPGAAKDISASYNKFKQFEGKQHTSMKVGRSHKWYYDKGEWREKKITPDLWEISYSVTKRRAGKRLKGMRS